MISDIIYSKGKDNFKDDTFSAREWSAPTMVSPKEIRERIDSFALCGRKIKRMRLIGLSYFHTRDWVEEAAYRQVEHLPEEECQLRSNYQTIDPAMQFSRYAQIDEPFLIEFEDGDVFEIDTPQDPEFRMSMNCIPWWIKAGTNQPNAEADILFSPCVGQKIVAVEVNTQITDKDPMLFCAFNEPPYQRELVSNVTLRLENGLGLQISPDFDYCEVACVDVSNEWVKISFSELKDALFNWEDLHADEVTGFEAESHITDDNPSIEGNPRHSGIFMNKAFYRTLRMMHREYGDMKLGYVRYNDVVYSSVPYIEGLGFFSWSSFRATNRMHSMVRHPFDGGEWKVAEFIKTEQRESDDLFAHIPKLINAVPLAPVSTERFAVKLFFDNGECRKYVLPIPAESEHEEVLSYLGHVFTDSIWASVSVIPRHESRYEGWLCP